MDRRVLFAILILFAGGATGVGVATFAFVGLDDANAEATVVWESEPAAGDDGTGAATVDVDGETRVVQPTVEDGDRAVRAVTPGAGRAWTTRISGDTDDPVGVSRLATGTLAGDPVVALTTAPGRLVVLNAEDGHERFAVDLDGPGGVVPAIGDPAGDGTNLVVAAATDGSVLAVDAAGDPAFEASVGGRVERRPLVVAPDPDPDGYDGAIPGGVAVSTAGTDPGTVHLLDGSGEERWRTTPTVTTVGWNIAETRRGPVLTLGGSNGNLEALEVADGSSRYEVPLQDRPVAVGGVDGGQVLVGGVGSIWAVNLLDGEVVWKQQYGGQTRVNAPAVGEVTGDDTPESVAVNREGEVLGLTRNGEVVTRGSVPETVVYAGPRFADADDDGTDEVLVVDQDGVVRALST
ncbi:Outer membrane protein assembly factor BamB, contains PQQ-like beta-propeller repeat [Halorubrum aquaticum]|uniref:Outer membrane protein assembly factor BamB, contains PQQ-like beta-propeller repeat n=1 Tax=Halorubrum aquaticum TaxID=387340 RepID=A0A1I2ZEK4_9EURY|nr:PQQ-binding-like beta-propeller repeat protein [Halorubrum aquaticum]SFH36312.1 Outer membrane protein assembly factor BamB, contains PQQ-like beta-propeller repeat [Halorubrum aquaticum]